MRAIIIANGDLQPGSACPPGDLLIAADGGARNCLLLGLRPAVVIGDLDSLDSEILEDLRTQGVQIIQHPRHKDFTDLELALDYATQQGADEIYILAGLGARWDQTVANILLPAGRSSVRISLLDGNQQIHYLHSGDRLQITGKPGDIVSLIPLEGEARGVSTQGLEYPLYGESLHFSSTRGVSNALLSDEAWVSLEEGSLVCIVIHDSQPG